MRRSALLLPAAAFALGCSDHVTEPLRDSAPSLRTEITTVEEPLIISFNNQDFATFFGVSLEDLPAWCAGEDPGELAETKIITHPSRQGTTSEHRLTRTEISGAIWALDIGPGGDHCDLPGTVPPLAVGTVRVLINDNEGFLFETAPGANAVVIRFAGILTNPETGQRYHVKGALQLVILQDGTFKELPKPFIQVTPIGG